MPNTPKTPAPRSIDFASVVRRLKSGEIEAKEPETEVQMTVILGGGRLLLEAGWVTENPPRDTAT